MISRRTRVIVSVALLASIALGFSGLLDQRGRGYAEEALQRALLTFALARTLNGVISVAQETEIALEPGGVGVVLMPGELLDPINDLIERFSWVMLASAASLGVQSTLLKVSSWWGINLFFALSALTVLALLWRPDWLRAGTRRIILRVLGVAVFLRYAVPVLLLATQLVSTTFLAEDRERATGALSETSSDIRALNDAEDETTSEEVERSLMKRFSDFVGERMQAADVEGRVRALRETLSRTVSSIIDLIVVFALETILIPLAFLWLLLRIAGRIVGGP